MNKHQPIKATDTKIVRDIGPLISTSIAATAKIVVNVPTHETATERRIDSPLNNSPSLGLGLALSEASPKR